MLGRAAPRERRLSDSRIGQSQLRGSRSHDARGRSGYRGMSCPTIWLPMALGGLAPSAEVLESSATMSCGEIQIVRRLVARGRPAADVPSARLAVALARQQQRRSMNRWGLLVLVLLLGGFAWIVAEVRIDRFELPQIVLAVLAILLLRSLWTAWRDRRYSARAELENMQVLERLGTPYAERRESSRVQAPTIARVTGAIALLVFYDLSFGSFTASSRGHAATVGRVVVDGALYAVFMTLFSFAFLRNKVDERERQPTAGTRL
jgi:hypothetical protein